MEVKHGVTKENRVNWENEWPRPEKFCKIFHDEKKQKANDKNYLLRKD